VSVGTRAYVASHFAIEIDKKIVGFCRSVEGGGLKSEVLSYQTSGAPTRAVQDTWRYGGKPKFDDITVQIGMGMSEDVYKWINAFFSRDLQRKDGAVLIADFGYNEKARRTFKQALITEVQMPGVDGSDKNSCYMTVKIAPEILQYEPGTGGKLKCEPAVNQKKWLAANFVFKLDGLLDPDVTRVLKVDGFTIKQQILDYHYGRVGNRFPIKVPGRLEYPNMTFYVPEVDSKPFLNVLNQRWNANVPKAGAGITGSLTYRSSDKKDLCTVKLEGVDVTAVEPEKLESSSDSLHRMKVSIHVEKMTFTYHG
jgi:phage tail-like protein